jgi:hypothetical protein
MALCLYFALAGSRSSNLAHLWLLPLTISFLLQPHGRGVWNTAPTRVELLPGTSTRQAVDTFLGQRPDQRLLTLVRRWPRDAALDLAYANLGSLGGRRTANGYDPLAPVRNRAAFGGMGVGGALPGAFFRTEPLRLAMLGVRFVQAPASALVTTPDAAGLGDTLDIALLSGETRFLPLPVTPATEVRLASTLADAVGVPDESPIAEVRVHLASGRELPLVLLAGRDTAEWAYDRADVRPNVAHRRAPVLESWPGQGGGFLAHRYLGTLALPGRYLVDGVGLTRLAGPGRLILSRLGVVDTASGRGAPASLISGYLSEASRLREVANTVGVRLFDLPAAPGLAWVVERLRTLPDDDDALKALAPRLRHRPRREARPWPRRSRMEAARREPRVPRRGGRRRGGTHRDPGGRTRPPGGGRGLGPGVAGRGGRGGLGHRAREPPTWACGSARITATQPPGAGFLPSRLFGLGAPWASIFRRRPFDPARGGMLASLFLGHATGESCARPRRLEAPTGAPW